MPKYDFLPSAWLLEERDDKSSKEEKKEDDYASENYTYPLERFGNGGERLTAFGRKLLDAVQACRSRDDKVVYPPHDRNVGDDIYGTNVVE